MPASGPARFPGCRAVPGTGEHGVHPAAPQAPWHGQPNTFLMGLEELVGAVRGFQRGPAAPEGVGTGMGECRLWPRQCHKAAHWQGWGCCSGCTCFAGATCPHQGSAHVLPMGLLRDDPDRGMWCGVGCPCRVQPVPSGAGQCHSMGFILPCSEQRADGWST